MSGAQLFDKMIPAGKNGGAEHQYDHNLSGGIAAADQDMAQQTLSAILLVSRQTELAAGDASCSMRRTRNSWR